jgi:hypothetical protein
MGEVGRDCHFFFTCTVRYSSCAFRSYTLAMSDHFLYVTCILEFPSVVQIPGSFRQTLAPYTLVDQGAVHGK